MKIEIWDKFWKLVIIDRDIPHITLWWQKKTRWLCKCDCWRIHSALDQRLKEWNTKSCWCSWETFIPHNRKVFKYWDSVWPFTYIWEDNCIKWKRRIKVRCFCSREKTTTLYVAEHSKSCGCLNFSKRPSKRAEQVRINSSNRRGKIKTNSDWTITIKSTQALLNEQGWVCNNCGIDIMNRDYRHLDHIHPISKWGVHSITNTQWLCCHCNLVKSDKY